jgi:hypothetical protein
MTKEQLIEEIKAGRITTVDDVKTKLIELYVNEYTRGDVMLMEGVDLKEKASHLLSEHGAKVVEAKAPKPLTAEEFTKEVSPEEIGVRAYLLEKGMLKHVHEWMRRFASQQDAELKEQFDRYYKQWENQRTTIQNFHTVYKKHFGNDEMSDSENMDKEIESLRKKVGELTEALQSEKDHREMSVQAYRNKYSCHMNVAYRNAKTDAALGLTGDKEKGDV